MPSIPFRPPSVDALLRAAEAAPLIDTHGRAAVTQAIRDELAARRAHGVVPGDDDAAPILAAAARRLDDASQPSLRAVLNLTGTVIHTNLGRAPLAPVAAEAMAAAALGPVNLEYDLGGGARGARDDHVEALICSLTGAEAATVVNNNAAAVLLCLSALARRREVLVSRGELIEIGGSFRMPDIMAAAGCKLVEVGTTNRTHAKDFESALGPKTALIMKVHMANYRIDGFTAEAAERDLAALAGRHGVPFLVDLGSGTLIDFKAHGLPPEPTPQQALAGGADLVTFSGDKLLGGPQAGIICGQAALIKKLKKHPMKRALRLDKTAIAALAATLQLYRDPDRLAERLPVLRLLTRPQADIRAQAERLLAPVAEALGARASVAIVDCQSQVGSGSLPVDRLPSVALEITPTVGKRGQGKAADRLAAAFRALPVPVIGRLSSGVLMLDLRCLDGAGEDTLRRQLPRLGAAENP